MWGIVLRRQGGSFTISRSPRRLADIRFQSKQAPVKGFQVSGFWDFVETSRGCLMQCKFCTSAPCTGGVSVSLIWPGRSAISPMRENRERRRSCSPTTTSPRYCTSRQPLRGHHRRWPNDMLFGTRQHGGHRLSPKW